MDKIEHLKEERKNIAKTYSSKKIKDTYIDEVTKEYKDVLYVKVKKIIEETNDTKSFILVPDIEKGIKELPPFKAGQYISIRMFIDEYYTTRAYSLSSSPGDTSKYRITIKRVLNGLVSNIMLDEIKVGDGLTISRPTGDFGYNPIRDEENVLGIAGGSGITPFMSLALAINEGIENCNLTVFYSVKTEEDIIFKSEIEHLLIKKC